MQPGSDRGSSSVAGADPPGRWTPEHLSNNRGAARFVIKNRGAASFAMKIALLVLLTPLLLILIAVPVLALAVDLGGVVRKQLVTAQPDIEAKLGRKVRFGAVKLKLLPTLAAEVSDLAIEAAPGATGAAAAPLMQLATVRVGVAIWPLLTSLGHEVQVSHIEADGLQVTVVRTADGHLSYEDVVEHLSTADPRQKTPMTTEQKAYLQRLSLSRLALTRIGLHFYDQQPGAVPLTIDQLDLIARDVRLSRPFTVTLDAAVLAAQRNFHFAVTLGPIPADLEVEQPIALLRSLDLKVQPLQIGPVLRFVPQGALAVAGALFNADLILEMPTEKGDLLVKGSIGAKGLTLEQRPIVRPDAKAEATVQTGRPTDVSLRLDLRFQPLSGNLNAQLLEVAIDDMTLSGTMDVRTLWTRPEVHALLLNSRGLMLEKLLSILPPGAVPQGAVLRGPMTVHAAGSGTPAEAQVDARVDLTDALVSMPELHKPEKVALSAEFSGKLQQGLVDIDKLGVVLGPMALLVKGQARGGGDVDLHLDTGRVDLDRLLRLLPSVKKAVPPGATLAGALQVTGTVKRRGEELFADAQIAMTGADARTPDLELVGGARLAATVKSTPSSAHVEADLDLGAARLLVPGTLDKGAGVPMRVKVNVDRAGQVVTVREADLTLPGGEVRMRGQADMAGHKLDLTVPLCELDLSRLSQVVLALRKQAPGLLDGKVRFAVAVSGDPQKLSTVKARISDLDLFALGGHLRGMAEVEGLDEPRHISFGFDGEGLDLDRLTGGKSAPPARDDKAIEVPKFARHLNMEGRVHLKNGRFKGQTMRDLLMEVRMVNGNLMINTLRGEMFGGSLSASGSTLDLGPSTPRFDFKIKADQIEIADAMAMGHGSSIERHIEGKANLDLSAVGTGLSFAQVAPHLSGQLGLALNDGKLPGLSVAGTVVNPILAHLQMLKQVKVPAQMALQNLAVHFDIHDGKLHTTQPLKTSTAEGDMALSGTIGLDQSLALRGDLNISPEVLKAASGGRVVPPGPVPVSLNIGGTLAAPRVQLTDLGKTVAALAGAVLKGKGKELLGGLGKAIGGQVGEQVGGQIGGVVQNLSSPEALKAQAQQAEQRAAEEAKKRLAEEAQKRLKDQENQLGKGLKGLFGK